MKKKFEKYLLENDYSKNTISAYIFAIKMFEKEYKGYLKNNLLAFKSLLIDKYKPKTVNLRIQAINTYLDYLQKGNLKLSQIKIQQKTYIENVISNEDYEFLKKSLLKDKNYKWYFIVRFLACTGARISELIKLKVEHIIAGYYDIYTKGGKCRRIYIPIIVKKEYLKYSKDISKTTGYVFINKNDNIISTRGISIMLKKLARKYGIDEKVVYPHSFRHLFAKNFIEKYHDIALLADLMGHDSIDTTRIYLRMTNVEQKNIVDDIVKW